MTERMADSPEELFLIVAYTTIFSAGVCGYSYTYPVIRLLPDGMMGTPVLTK